MRIFRNLLNQQRGMTGLETAIIMIAFVVVAAIFGYAIISAGLFAVNRDSETLYEALQQSRSNLIISGSVICMGDNVTYNPVNMVGKIKFTVKNALTGNAIDMTPNTNANLHQNKCTISLYTRYNFVNNIQWTCVHIGADDGDNLLEPGEQFEVIIDINQLTPAGCPLTIPAGLLQANDPFTLEVKPEAGSYITIKRTMPPVISEYMDLH
jgi:archaeal flagellin FlaB